jgi:hypothetical protein
MARPQVKYEMITKRIGGLVEVLYWGIGLIVVIFVLIASAARSSKSGLVKTTISEFEELGRNHPDPQIQSRFVEAHEPRFGSREVGSNLDADWSSKFDDCGEDVFDYFNGPLESESAYAKHYLDRIPEALPASGETFRGKGMSFHKSNWVGLYKNLGRPSGREVSTFAVLVPELGNRYDANAVSIAVHGRHIANVPMELSAEISRFIAANGGLVKVHAVLWFDPRRVTSTVRVHLAMPYRMKDTFQTDLKVRRWASPKWGDALIGFVD